MMMLSRTSNACPNLFAYRYPRKSTGEVRNSNIYISCTRMIGCAHACYKVILGDRVGALYIRIIQAGLKDPNGPKASERTQRSA